MMDSSERDEPTEQPTNPSDDAAEASPVSDMVHDIEAAEGEPLETHPATREVDLADEEGFPPHSRPETPEDDLPTDDPLSKPGNQIPIEPAEPGMYYCDDEDPGIHPVLGELHHGENDYTHTTHPEELMAIASLVEAGVLRKV